MYVNDGDYIKDIEVNDLRNRYLLTKGSTQKMVNLYILFLAPLTQGEPASPAWFCLVRARTLLLTRKHVSSHAASLWRIC